MDYTIAPHLINSNYLGDYLGFIAEYFTLKGHSFDKF